jgi:hypothetical protein
MATNSYTTTQNMEHAVALLVEALCLHAGRSPVRVPDEVDFSIYLILPDALWA